jgi:GT2 family glycosyltransferase
MPQVSVLMPCFNAALSVEESLDSLARQSLVDFEAILVDDGSKDGTLDVLKRWAARDDRFRVLRQSHQGIIAALNTGLAACRAPLVARMDADDRSHPRRLERQLDYLRSNPEIAVAGCLVTGFPPENVREGFQVYLNWLNSLVDDVNIRREIFIESPLAHPSVMVRREWYEAAGGYQDHGWPEDYDLWLRLYLLGAGFGKVPEFLLEWRETAGRLTRRDRRYSLENFLRAKACYLVQGPLKGRDAVMIWGAGMMGRRLGKQLERRGVPLRLFVDIDPRKIGRTRRGWPIARPEELLQWWGRFSHPVLLAAVGARGARPLIRQQLIDLGLVEGRDWWSAA